jgi:hypothetical protein
MIFKALGLLSPTAKWMCEGPETYENIRWLPGDYYKPTKQEIEQKIAELNKQWIDTEYQRQRAMEYPPITDYLDGVVKGDQQQIAAYIAACQAVKAKYPKPE